jgi:tetratricopeptide (TPR) repeat protein
MHRLLGRFVREKAGSWNANRLEKLRRGLWGRLLGAADKVEGQPASADLALRLLSFDVSVESWSMSEQAGVAWGAEAHRVASALSEIGQFETARPWAEAAVTEQQHGDERGRVDHESLGISLHQVGYCLLRTGKYDEARPWFERAVAETEHGDVHGQVDQASLEMSRQALLDARRKSGP